MKWITNKRGGIYDLADNKLRICIHEIIGLDHMLFLTCHPLQMKDIDLNTESLEEAISISKKLIHDKVEMLTQEMNKFIDDDTEVELSRYKPVNEAIGNLPVAIINANFEKQRIKLKTFSKTKECCRHTEKGCIQKRR